MLQSLIPMSCLNTQLACLLKLGKSEEHDKKKVLDFNTSVSGESRNSCSPELTLFGSKVRFSKQIASELTNMKITSSGFIVAVLGMTIANKLGGSEPSDVDWFAEYEMSKDNGDVDDEGEALGLDVDSAG